MNDGERITSVDLPPGEWENTKAIFISNPQYYSAVWGCIIHHPGLVGTLQSLMGENIVWHHTILHGKPPERGTPFPMHQDYPFYPHDGPNFVDCLLHLDHTPIDNGCASSSGQSPSWAIRTHHRWPYASLSASQHIFRIYYPRRRFQPQQRMWSSSVTILSLVRYQPNWSMAKIGTDRISCTRNETDRHWSTNPLITAWWWPELNLMTKNRN